MSPNTVKAPAVHIKADEVQVVSEVALPEGHVVTALPTAATPAIARPSTHVRDKEIAAESETSLDSAGRRSTGEALLRGQQWVNRTWELTQATIAVAATLTGLGMFALSTLIMLWVLVTATDPSMVTTALAVVTLSLNALSSVLFLVVGFYFGRTNHQKVGGVGASEMGK